MAKKDVKGERLIDYTVHVAVIANEINSKYGKLDSEVYQKIDRLEEQRIKKALKKPFIKRVGERIQAPFKITSDLIQALDKRGVNLGLIQTINVAIRATGILNSKTAKAMKQKVDIENESRILKWIKARLREKSTYAGIASVLTLIFGMDIETGTIEPIAGAIVSVIVAYQVIQREVGSEKV